MHIFKDTGIMQQSAYLTGKTKMIHVVLIVSVFRELAERYGRNDTSWI